MKEWLIRLAVGAAGAVIVVIAVSWVASGELVEPASRDIGRPPLDLEASNITFASGSGTLIHGWLSHGKPRQGVVLLLHALRGDRRDMLSRAEFLRSHGYSVLLIDFQAHGETRGRRITFGDLESRDVTAAIQYLHHKLPDERVGVIGASLGADAFVLADNRPPVAAVVLEQMYPTFERAIESLLRLHLGPLGAIFAPLVRVEVQSRLEIPTNRLRPIDRMSHLGAPVLIVNGTRDKHTPIEDARALFSAASEPKELWAVEGAGHVNLHAFAKAEYEHRVGDFLARYLPAAGDVGKP
jgi:esterase/lipase